MTTHKVKGIMTGRLYELIQSGTHSTKELAEKLGASENTVRVLRCRLRRYGLLPGYQTKKTIKPGQSKPTCPACKGKGYIEIKAEDGFRYKRCPDCK